MKKLDIEQLPENSIVDVCDSKGSILFPSRQCRIRKWQDRVSTGRGSSVPGLWNVRGQLEHHTPDEYWGHDTAVLHFSGSDDRLDIVLQVNGEFLLTGNGYYSEK